MVIAWHSFIAPTYAASACLALAFLYRIRCPRLAASLNATAYLIVFAAVGAPLSYLAAMTSAPLIDGTLARADHALGFDWQRWHEFIGDPWPLRLAYFSFMPQCALVVLLLTGEPLRRYLTAFTMAALVCIAASVFLPARGVVPMEWTPAFDALRAGHLVIMGQGSEGIISFPSLHAALAVILIMALWRTPLRWPGLALNCALLLATPIDGAHYLVDVIAGAALGLFAWLGVGQRLSVGEQRRCDKAAPVAFPFRSDLPGLVELAQMTTRDA